MVVTMIQRRWMIRLNRTIPRVSGNFANSTLANGIAREITTIVVISKIKIFPAKRRCSSLFRWSHGEGNARQRWIRIRWTHAALACVTRVSTRRNFLLIREIKRGWLKYLFAAVGKAICFSSNFRCQDWFPDGPCPSSERSPESKRTFQ